jgi:5'-nucleotidase
MNVLICNDDGYYSTGINKLAQVVKSLGMDAVIVAPQYHMSGASRSRVSSREISWEKGDPISSFPCYILDGTPAACVVFGITSGLFTAFDFCLSGINAGENLGGGLTISGTFGAVLEAASYGVRGIAISRQHETGNNDPEKWDWSWVESVTRSTLVNVLKKKSNWIVANINMPNKMINEKPVFTKISNVSHFRDVYSLKENCITSSIEYNKALLGTTDDVKVFVEDSRISVSLLAGKLV